MYPKKPKQNVPGYIFVFTGCLAIMVIINVWMKLSKTDIIIRYGIRFYQTSSKIALILLILFAVILLIQLIRFQHNYHEYKTSMNLEHSKDEARKTGLSVSGKLDSNTIQDILSKLGNSVNSKKIQLMIYACRQHLYTMDCYQEKLSNLLQHNDASNLDENTSQVLDQVEQYMLRNVRKVINYINICDLNSEKHVELILEKLSACDEECTKQLNQVQEFLFVMADFLNKQGEDNTTPDKLETYKNCILESIQDDDD